MYSQEERPIEDFSGQKDLLQHDIAVFTQDNYAGFWLRFAAYIIDAIIAWVFLFIFSMVFGTGMAFSPNFEEVSAGFWGFMIVFYAGIILYFPLMESSKWQATLGKRAVGIIVTDMNGQKISFTNALGRFFAKILSAIILYIGFIMAGFTEKKQGLHDIVAGTLVIKGNRG